MRKLILPSTLTLSLFALFAVVPAQAGLILPDGVDADYSGDTTAGNVTFNRPVANGNSAPDALSDFADAVLYDTMTFQVSTSGIYDFFVTPVDPAFWSTYFFLYQTSFDPANPLENVLIGGSNDDSTSNVSQILFAGTDYIAVTTGFSNFDAGTFTDHITEVALVGPEPGTILLAGLGLFGVAYGARRRMVSMAPRQSPIAH